MPALPATQIAFTLTDPATKQTVRGEMVAEGQGLAIRLDGYGGKESAQGQGTPVFLEFSNGQLRLHLWHDINTADPVTHSLEGARECLRR